MDERSNPTHLISGLFTQIVYEKDGMDWLKAFIKRLIFITNNEI